ncbi:MAG: hypothetical protein KGH66_02605, partial [Candidatus Micrarchaeota archaeon]|nr:hypothetical protein [Candidatus Micrarchaeota archaeon]
NYVLKNFLNETIAQAQAQNVNVIMTNVSLSVYQTSPFAVNATLTALAIINSSQGSITYPISATGSASLNGTQDLFYAEAADPHMIRAQPGYPVAVPIGNSVAIQGSSSPFMLASGTLITEYTGTPTCSGVPAGYQNGNYILVTLNGQDIPQNVCGMAGLVTGTANTATPLVPYLVYPKTTGGPTANVFGLVQNGTSAILDGPALELLNASAIQLAIQNGYYYPSSLAPSYLGYGQMSLNQRSSAGMFSLNLFSRDVAQFDGTPASNIVVTSNAILHPSGQITEVVWVEKTGAGDQDPRAIILSDDINYLDMCYPHSGATTPMASLYISGTQYLMEGGSCPQLNQWTQFAMTYNGVTGNFYENGALIASLQQSGTLNYNYGICSGIITIGRYCGQSYNLNGKEADVQIYGQALSSTQIAQLYLNGIEASPPSNSVLLGWWPLNENANDLSGNGQVGASANVVYTPPTNYAGDPVYGGSLYYNMTNKILGAGNPGCASLTTCSGNTVIAPLFLGSSPITGNYSGRAAKFTYGSGLSVSNPTNTPTGSAVTGVFWIKPYSAEASGCNLWPINYGPDSGTGSSFLLGVAQSTLRPALATWANDYFPGSGPTLNLKSWNFLAGTVSGSTATIYLNNQSESATLGQAASIAHGQMSSSFGAACSNASVADIQLYNSVLTAQQLQALYRGGINGPPIPINTLTDWWPLNGNSTDYVNSKNNMLNTYTAYTTQYTNQTTGTSSGAAAFHLSDAAIPNVAAFGCTGSAGAGGCTGNYGYMQTNPSLIFNPSKFSVSFWMYPKSEGGSSTFVLANTNPVNSGANWWFEFSSGDMQFKSCNTNCNGASSSAGTANNQWHFVTGVFDGSNWYLYINGTLMGSCTSTCATLGAGASAMMFGTDACNGCSGAGDNNGYYNGYLSDVKFYSGAALTAAQAQQLYQNDSVAGLPANDVWPLNGAGPASVAAINQSVDVANSLNTGYMMSNTITCTISNSIKNQCGVYYTQP